jgi:two-component system OmpR family response regulator
MLSLAASSPSATAAVAAPARPRVLLVASEEAHRAVAVALRPRGYDVEVMADLPGAPVLAAFDAIALVASEWRDQALLEACRRLRTAGGPMLLVLLPGGARSAVVQVLEAGADDCLAGPHNPREVIARVSALIRRRGRNGRRYAGRYCVFDGHQLDSISMVVRGPDGRAAEITPAQHRLLTALLARPGEVVSREQLMICVMGEDTDSFDRAIDVHVSRLRRRLAQVSDVDLITNYRGVGYRLEVADVIE